MKHKFWLFALKYYKKNLKLILLYLLWVLIFAAVFSLYDLPVESVWYATGLCVLAGLIFLFVSFFRSRKRHEELIFALEEVTFSLEHLPVPQNYVDQDYKELIEALYAEKDKLKLSADLSKLEQTDYFTLWVHQIKTPISAMRLLLQSQAARDVGENGDAKETTADRNSADRNSVLTAELFKIEQYVEMVLGYLRLDSDTTDYVLKEYNLDAIVRQSVRKYANLFILKKIRLEYEGIFCKVLTDEKWLVFALDQIISNSLKYTDSTGVGKISIRLESEKILVIEDTGVGIEKEDLPRVFDRGFTGLNGRMDKKSTGIGLYLCRRTLGRLSHTISIESQVGVGTVLRIGLSQVESVRE